MIKSGCDSGSFEGGGSRTVCGGDWGGGWRVVSGVGGYTGSPERATRAETRGSLHTGHETLNSAVAVF